MRTIKNWLIAIFIGSMFLPYIPLKAQHQPILLLKATNSNVSKASLENAAGVVCARMEAYTGKKISFELDPSHSLIRIHIPEVQDLKTLVKLGTQKGAVNLYEIYESKNALQLFPQNSPVHQKLEEAQKTSENQWKICLDKQDAGTISKELISRQWPDSVLTTRDYQMENCFFILKKKEGFSPIFRYPSIASVNVSNDSGYGPEININLKPESVPEWTEATRRNMNKALAIVMDGQVLSAPVVRSVIETGRCMITGHFTNSDANFIASMAGHGELPIELELVK